jgi:hypothetical protein
MADEVERRPGSGTRQYLNPKTGKYEGKSGRSAPTTKEEEQRGLILPKLKRMIPEFKRGGKVKAKKGIVHKGEFVVKKSAAKKVGTKALNKVNQGRAPARRKR